jgi:predicted transcriptional regulator
LQPKPEKTLIIHDKTLKDGFTLIPNVVLESEILSPGAKIVYILLLSALQNGEVFPTYERLAESIGCTEKTVYKYLTELKNAGLIFQNTNKERGDQKQCRKKIC